jgi:hypothetical protein
MGKRYIRVKKDGFIYEYDETLAKNPSCEVIEEAEVLPEPEVVAVEVTKRGGRKAALDLSTADIPEPRTHTAPELAAEAGKKWPK